MRVIIANIRGNIIFLNSNHLFGKKMEVSMCEQSSKKNQHGVNSVKDAIVINQYILRSENGPQKVLVTDKKNDRKFMIVSYQYFTNRDLETNTLLLVTEGELQLNKKNCYFEITENNLAETNLNIPYLGAKTICKEHEKIKQLFHLNLKYNTYSFPFIGFKRESPVTNRELFKNHRNFFKENIMIYEENVELYFVIRRIGEDITSFLPTTETKMKLKKEILRLYSFYIKHQLEIIKSVKELDDRLIFKKDHLKPTRNELLDLKIPETVKYILYDEYMAYKNATFDEIFINEQKIQKMIKKLKALNSPHNLRIIKWSKSKTFQSYIVVYESVSMDLNSLLSLVDPRDSYINANRLPRHLIFCFINKLIDALEFMHKRNLAHRDICPENIYITPKGTIRLSGFENLKSVSMTSKCTVSKNRYSYPEEDLVKIYKRVPHVKSSIEYFHYYLFQGGRPVNLISLDRWALGILLVKMETGKYPFSKDDYLKYQEDSRYFYKEKHQNLTQFKKKLFTLQEPLNRLSPESLDLFYVLTKNTTNEFQKLENTSFYKFKKILFHEETSSVYKMISAVKNCNASKRMASFVFDYYFSEDYTCNENSGETEYSFSNASPYDLNTIKYTKKIKKESFCIKKNEQKSLLEMSKRVQSFLEFYKSKYVNIFFYNKLEYGSEGNKNEPEMTDISLKTPVKKVCPSKIRYYFLIQSVCSFSALKVCQLRLKIIFFNKYVTYEFHKIKGSQFLFMSFVESFSRIFNLHMFKWKDEFTKF